MYYLLVCSHQSLAYIVSYSVWITITECHRLGVNNISSLGINWLKQQFVSHGQEAAKLRSECRHGQVLGEDLTGYVLIWPLLGASSFHKSINFIEGTRPS